MFKVSKKTLEQYQKYSTVIIAEKLITTLNWQLKSYKTSDVDDETLGQSLWHVFANFE